MKRYITGLCSVAAVLLSYWLIINPLFFLHGMRDIPFYLMALSVIAVMINIIFKGKRTVSVLIPTGYITGFICSYMFHSEWTNQNGTSMSNMWLIWIIIYLCVIVFGILFDFIYSKVKRA